MLESRRIVGRAETEMSLARPCDFGFQDAGPGHSFMKPFNKINRNEALDPEAE